MIVPCGRCFVDMNARSRACARPADHAGICSGLPLSIDLGKRRRMSNEEISAVDAEALLRVLRTESGITA